VNIEVHPKSEMTMYRILRALPLLAVLKAIPIFFVFGVPLAAQAPSIETLTLSLKTISKALSGCRETYTMVQPGASAPLVRLVIGAAYDKDLKSLDEATKFTDFLVANPSRITGQALVGVLSTSDDFSIGVGSTQSDILRAVMREDPKITPQMADGLVSLATSLGECQKSLFNAGDDYVELVMRFVGSEDQTLAALRSKRQ